MNVLSITGVLSFDYFFSLIFWFGLELFPLFLILALISKRWFK